MCIHEKTVLIFYYCYFSTCAVAVNMETGCWAGQTWHACLILSLENYHPVNSRIAYAFFFLVFICFVLAACTHLALLHYNPIINVLKFCDDFYKPVAKFRILYGCIQLYRYMPPRFTFAKCACDILIGVLLSCNILTSFIADGPKVIL